MRKVQINAQVTAMISSLEVFGNVTVIILLAVTKGTSLFSLMHGMMFYAILIPRTFLMNTSHNKDRIVEKGWKNIIKNLIGKPNNSIQDNAIVPNAENIMLKRRRKRNSPNNELGLFTIEKSMDPTDTSAINPALKQGPSHGKVQPARFKPGRNTESLDEQDLEDINDENEIMNKLVLSMLTEIRDELSYISYFKQMVTHLDLCRRGESISTYDLEHEFSSICSQQIKKQKVKGKKGRKLAPRRPNKSEDHSSLDISIETRKNGTIGSQKSSTNENLENMISRRSNLLRKIFISLDKKENYDMLIEQLIDLEENCVKC